MSDRARVAVVLLAAGQGRRVGAPTNKVLLPLAGRPVFAWSLRSLAEVEYVDQLVVVVREEDRTLVENAVARETLPCAATLVAGGDTRHRSEWNALRVLADDIDAGKLDVVAIHDTARPLAGPGLFQAAVEAAGVHGAAVPVTELSSLVPRAHHEPWTLSRRLVAVQTPQAFAAGPLLDAYRRAAGDGFEGTDTASCVQRYTDLDISCVAGSATNMKITFPEDVEVAERLLLRSGAEQPAAY